MSKIKDNGILREMTASEQAEYDAMQIEYENRKILKKLEQIREIRNQNLFETDYLALSDNTMSDEMKAFRKSMRDIPQDYTTESQYDLLLARDSDGKLTHTVWEKP